MPNSKPCMTLSNVAHHNYCHFHYAKTLWKPFLWPFIKLWLISMRPFAKFPHATFRCLPALVFFSLSLYSRCCSLLSFCILIHFITWKRCVLCTGIVKHAWTRLKRVCVLFSVSLFRWITSVDVHLFAIGWFWIWKCITLKRPLTAAATKCSIINCLRSSLWCDSKTHKCQNHSYEPPHLTCKRWARMPHQTRLTSFISWKTNE